MYEGLLQAAGFTANTAPFLDAKGGLTFCKEYSPWFYHTS